LVHLSNSRENEIAGMVLIPAVDSSHKTTIRVRCSCIWGDLIENRFSQDCAETESSSSIHIPDRTEEKWAKDCVSKELHD
jgi:hypothetical protein